MWCVSYVECVTSVLCDGSKIYIKVMCEDVYVGGLFLFYSSLCCFFIVSKGWYVIYIRFLVELTEVHILLLIIMESNMV